MESLFYNISQVLGIAIVHSLWQGLLIWFLLRVVFSMAPALSAVKKYNMAAAAMLGIAVWFMVTLFNEAGNFNWHPVAITPATGFVPQGGLVNQLSPFKAQADRYYYVIEGYLPYISALYLTGLVVNLLKLSYCRVKLIRIKKALLPAGDMQWLVDDFSERLDIRRYVRVNFSSLVDVPCMIGYLKPIILLPISLSANLSVAETEAILLHELAHIKRNDYLVNLLQQVINSLLFFNPFAQMINRLISAERENCCDDLVVQTTNNPLVYARALLKLEESRQTNLQLALAASTKKHYLLTRIERIMKTKQNIGNIRHLVLAILLLAGSLSSIAWLNPEIKNGKVTVKAVKPAEVIDKLNDMFADTTRKKAVKVTAKSKYTVQKFKQYKTRNDFDTYYDNSFNDPQLEKLGKEINKHADVINKYYDSDKFKAFSAEMEKRGKDVEAFYNSDELKRITAEQADASAAYSKVWDGRSGQIDAISKQMGVAGDKLGKYYQTKEFKDLNTRLGKKYGIDVNGIYNPHTERYAEYQKDIDQYIPADIKEVQNQMKKLGQQMRELTNAPEVREQQEALRNASDAMRKAYDTPEVKQQQEEMRKLGEQMRTYADNPELKKEKELLRQASARLRAYTNTPEFKAKVKEFKASRKAFNWDTINDNNNDNNNNNDKSSDVIKELPPPLVPAEAKEPVKP